MVPSLKGRTYVDGMPLSTFQANCEPGSQLIDFVTQVARSHATRRRRCKENRHDFAVALRRAAGKQRSAEAINSYRNNALRPGLNANPQLFRL
jgi:hypothetical protein